MNKKIKTAQDVVRWRLCVGCGVCAFLCPNRNIALKDIATEGIRPVVGNGGCAECGECISACPGIGTVHGREPSPECLPELHH